MGCLGCLFWSHVAPYFRRGTLAKFQTCLPKGAWYSLDVQNGKHPRLKRKRDRAEKAAEAGLKSAQDVLALVVAKADPKAPGNGKRKP